MTLRQSQALDFIRQHMTEKGFPPTSREIQHHFGFQSQNSAISILKALQRVGAITWTQNTARSIRLVEKAGNGQNEAVCPTCGARRVVKMNAESTGRSSGGTPS